MKTNQNAGGAGDGQNPPAGGAGDNTTDDNSDGGAGGDGGSPKPVSKADLDRALADMHRFKSAARDAAAKLEETTRTLNELKTKQATDAQDFKALYEAEKAAREESEQASGKLKESVVFGERYRALLPKLKEAGFRDDALNLIDKMDLSLLEVEATTNGRFIIHGTDMAVAAAKKDFPYAFESKRVRVNGGGGGNSQTKPKAWTPDDLVKLERQCKAKGDMKPYHAAISEYQKNKAGKAASS